jgi:HAD superfamily hydrolase (TIGR01484 family)
MRQRGRSVQSHPRGHIVRVSAVATGLSSAGFRAWDTMPRGVGCLATLLGKSRDCSRVTRSLHKTPLTVVQTSRMSASSRPRPFTEFQPHGVRGVLTDIDDTLTTAGAITPEALQALADLKAAGLPVIAITGRPKGWSEPFARAWPIDAIVAENGAVALFRDGDHLKIEYAQDEATRRANGLRLQQVAARIQHEVPGATLARDSAGRVTDIAIDHAEFMHLPAAQIDEVVALMRAEGMNATVSSIHINGWFGTHDKLSGARWIVQCLLGRDLDAESEHWVYVGDSTNDQLMFGHFDKSIGVANLLDFAAELTVWPRFITQLPRGAGFAEVAAALLRGRVAEAGAK